jgi:hypothetical protein
VRCSQVCITDSPHPQLLPPHSPRALTYQSAGMFSSSARRAALTAPSNPIIPSLSHLGPRVAVASKPGKHQTHQRRLSSSKPSNPPADGPKGVAEAVPPSQARPESEKKSRAGRKKSAKEDGGSSSTNKTKQVEPAHNLPSVPSTQHISPTRKWKRGVKDGRKVNNYQISAPPTSFRSTDQYLSQHPFPSQ